MSEAQKKFYLTTPIYYVNARPHIGHAYTTIVADVLARRHRLLGDDTFFLTGTDEHGQKIERSAGAAGIAPQQFADQVSAQFRTLWDRMGLTYDRYIRTTDECHKRGVQKLFADLYHRGFIYLSTYTGSYCVSDEAFVDAPVGTPCPDCGRLLEEVTEENFFFKLSEFQEKLLDLIESNELLIEPATAQNEVLSFLRGDVRSVLERTAHLPRIVAEYDPSKGPELRQYEDDGWAAVRWAVSAGLFKTAASGTPYVPGALKDLSISRSSFTWGIPVPESVQKAAGTTQKHVVYVWLDALANYMTAIGYGSDGPADEAEFKKYWPADLHLVGKEITRFHCVYWPAFLMAAGLPLPKAITAHGWLLFDNSKMSKSKGNIVRTETILEGFGEHVYAKQFPESSKQERDHFASDVLRYFLLREVPFGQDGSFSFDAMITRYNADLANGYGNLVSRTLKLIEQNLSSTITEVTRPHILRTPVALVEPDELQRAAQMSTETDSVIDVVTNIEQVGNQFESNRFEVLTQTISARIKIVDIYLSSHEPWKLAKSTDPLDKQKVNEILGTAAESIRIITALLYPILPFVTGKVWTQLGLGDIEVAAANGDLKNLAWGGLKPGTKLGPLAPIFPRADKGLAQIMIDMENPAPSTPEPTETTHPGAPPRSGAPDPAGKLSVGGSDATTTHNGPTPSHTETAASGIFASTPAAPAETSPTDASPQINIDDFVKVELRVAEIKVAERIPKADKLLRLEVDLGPAFPTRQILSGIAEWYTPEDLIGRRIIVITNLAPRKMRGLESHGMLLAASEEGGKPFLATVPEGVPVGTRLK